MEKYSIEISSPIDRENLVAEIWDGEELLAELNQEGERLELEIYTQEENKLQVDYKLFVEALITAKINLANGS